MFAHHHFVIAAARAVRIKVGRLDAVLLQIFSSGAIFLDRSGGEMWSVVTLSPNTASTRQSEYHRRSWLQLHVVEVGSATNVGGIFFPGVGLPLGTERPRQRSSPAKTSA